MNIKMKIKSEVIDFGKLISGRCFIIPEIPNRIYIKLDKRRVQQLDDENNKGNMLASRPIQEVMLFVKQGEP